MRKVMFKYHGGEQEHEHEGMFHQWAAKCIETNDGRFGNYTVALVELPNGLIVELEPYMIRFVIVDDFK